MPALVQLRVAAALAVALSIAAGAYWLYSKGGRDTEDEIERHNVETGAAAEGAVGAWRRCINAGGVYEFASGECSGTAPSGR